MSKSQPNLAEPVPETSPAEREASPAPELSALLVATAAGDRRAFKALYEATNRKMFGVALLILKRREAAEDVLQDAYVRVWTEARRYDPERGPPLPWLSRIVRNLAIDHLRRDRGLTEDIADQAEILAAPALPVAERADLNRGLARLGADHREILTLAFVHGYTHEELADRLGLPLGTAKSRVRRGLQQLQAYFEGESSGAGVLRMA
ncbi:RNA polymerase sigma factor [Phenylobacterium montanum]|uniref:RNA polymerase sigma factor n=1 Tax=Phenylobacterium montanum TaxID=2823693 RepID=A0A975G2B3_9CAUL|nr:sigma-70 family RNA polymerase sigma factor [Caulobacter sp. S6]QUD89825.1 sigma-70 family RNA polymerase sigma factor [Caulobacter sp. S6]